VGSGQGIDAGKKIKGRKRHLITDRLGLVLAVLVTAANVHDTTGGTLLLDDMAADRPRVTKVWADGGHQNSIFNHGVGVGGLGGWFGVCGCGGVFWLLCVVGCVCGYV
jgi:hypothetical protein